MSEEFSSFHEFIGFHEIRERRFVKALFSEFLGTFILIVSGCGSVVTLDPEGKVGNIQPAATFAMTVAMIVWTLGHVSGAHINPTVSLCFLVTGHLSLVKFVMYTICQCSGAISGSAVVWFMVPPDWRSTIGSTVFAEGLTLWQGFLVEVLATFFLILAVFATSDRLRTDHGGSEPLTIGLVVFMQSAWAVYWIAPNVGGVCGAVLYQHVLAEKPRDAAEKLVRLDLEDKEIKIDKKGKEENGIVQDSPSHVTQF